MTVTCNLRVPVYTPLVSYGDIIPYITNARKCTVIIDTLKLLEKGWSAVSYVKALGGTFFFCISFQVFKNCFGKTCRGLLKSFWVQVVYFPLMATKKASKNTSHLRESTKRYPIAHRYPVLMSNRPPWNTEKVWNNCALCHGCVEISRSLNNLNTTIREILDYEGMLPTKQWYEDWYTVYFYIFYTVTVCII